MTLLMQVVGLTSGLKTAAVLSKLSHRVHGERIAQAQEVYISLQAPGQLARVKLVKLVKLVLLGALYWTMIPLYGFPKGQLGCIGVTPLHVGKDSRA